MHSKNEIINATNFIGIDDNSRVKFFYETP